MDEENQNNEQSTAQKIEENINDTANAVKDGANLAKDASTGNVLGVAKDTVNLLNNKKVRKAIIIAILIPVIIIIFIASAFFIITGKIGEAFKEAADSIINLFAVDYSQEGDGTITLEDESIDKIIEEIEKLGIDFDDLELMGDIDYDNPDIQDEYQKAKRKYIKKFVEAQAVTQTLYTNPPEGEDPDKTYGKVYVYRPKGQNTDSMADSELLSYVQYDEMQEKIANGEDVQNLFTVESNGENDAKLVIPYSSTINGETTVQLKTIDYKSVVAPYTTPITFFVYLAMITKNPEYVSAVTDLVKEQSEIRITILDAETTTTTTEEYTYVRNTNTWTYDAELKKAVKTKKSETIESQPTTNTITEVTPIAKVTYVKTWFSEQTITYVLDDQSEVNEEPTILDKNNDPSMADENEPLEVPNIAVGSSVVQEWSTNKVRKITTITKTKNYKEGHNTNVQYRAGEKGDQGIKDLNNNQKVDENEKVDENTTFVGLLDNYFKKPNSNNYETPGPSLVKYSDWLFFLFQKDPSLQNQEQIMRYILYKYTGKDYGVTELDLSMFEPGELSTSTSVNSLADYLYPFAHGGKDAPMSADGKYYKMYGDSAGWPTIGNADLQWKSHHSKFNIPGKVLKNGEETEVTSIEEYVNGLLGKGAEAKYTNEEISAKEIYIEKAIVDEIGNAQIQSSLDAVKRYTSGLNLSTQQLYALVHVYRSRPAWISGDTINGYKSFKEAYQAAAAKYEINSWEFNRFIWDEWWSRLGGGQPGHIYSRDMEFETYVKGILDYSQSSAGPVGARTKYIYYTQEQLNRFSYAPNKPVTRNSSNEQEIFTYVENTRAGSNSNIVEVAYQVADHFLNSGVKVHYAGSSNPNSTNNGRYCVSSNIQGAWDYPIQNPERYGVVCATFVSLTIWKAGLIDEATINSYNYNSCASLKKMLESAGSSWQQITDQNELQEGDIVICKDHTWIYIDGNKCLDQNYCVITSSGKDLRGNLQKGYYTGFQKAFRYVGG